MNSQIKLKALWMGFFKYMHFMNYLQNLMNKSIKKKGNTERIQILAQQEFTRDNYSLYSLMTYVQEWS